MKNGMGLNKQQKQEATQANQELLKAVEAGDIKKGIELLSVPGIDINVQNKEGNTPLLLAAHGGNKEFVAMLLAAGLSSEKINTQNEYGDTALMVAAAEGHQDIVELLLDAGLTREQVNIQDELGTTALMRAALYGNTEIVKMLLATGLTGEHINIKNSLEYTALMDAAYDGNREHVELFLPYLSADQITTVNDEGRNAIQLAAQMGHTHIIKLFLSALHSKVDNALLGVLTTIAECNNAESMQRLLDSGVTADQLNLQDEFRQTPLIIAAAHGASDVVAVLVPHLTLEQINTHDIEGKTALRYAIEVGIEGMVQLFLDAGLTPEQISVADISGWTALMSAAAYDFGTTDIVRMLLDTGLSVEQISIMSDYGETALMNACESGNKEIVQMLLDAGLTFEHINFQDAYGKTALSLAANEEIKQLIQARLDELAGEKK